MHDTNDKTQCKLSRCALRGIQPEFFDDIFSRCERSAVASIVRILL
jgi:hypothetical protein